METFERVNPPIRRKRTNEHAEDFSNCLKVGDGFVVMLESGQSPKREAKNLRAQAWRLKPQSYSVSRIVGGILVKRTA